MAFEKLFRWWSRRRQPPALPDSLWQDTVSDLPFIDRLDAESRNRLRSLTEAFLAKKEFTSAGGLELTDAMCVSIAAQGCLPILNLGLECYRDWVGIIVYPDEFVIPRTFEDEDGIVHEYDEIAAGEAWEGGPLLISWQDAQMSGEGYNVIIHEFAHKLDMLNGEVHGIPALPPGMSARVWQDTLLEAYDHFLTLVEEAETSDSEILFDPYAAENPGEFFAVMSEAFFETPDLLRQEYAALYAQFVDFYRQDPFTTLYPDSSELSDQRPA